MTKISLSDIALFILRGVSDFYAPHLPPLNPLNPLNLFRKQSRGARPGLTLNPEPDFHPKEPTL